jgi:hypothetical protein
MEPLLFLLLVMTDKLATEGESNRCSQAESIVEGLMMKSKEEQT